MNVQRIAVILIALVAGGAAFYMALTSQNSESDAPVTIVQSAKEETVGVLVASANIARGQLLSPENMQWQDWPKKTVEKSDFFLTKNSGDVLQELQGAVARADFVTGEPMVEAKIVRAGSAGLMAALLSPGKRAVSLRVTAETASGGFILPGDNVDIIFTSGGGRNERQEVTTLFEGVKVLAVNEIFSDNPEVNVISGVNVTVELSPEDAETFVAARTRGNLSLALRSIFEKGEAQQPADADETLPESPRKKKVKIIRIGRT